MSLSAALHVFYPTLVPCVLIVEQERTGTMPYAYTDFVPLALRELAVNPSEQLAPHASIAICHSLLTVC